MQTEFRYVGPVSSPKLAPDAVLARVTSEAEAVRVSLIGQKASFIAATLGVSACYLSLIRNGHRPVPQRLVIPFCHATGTFLLKQYRDLQVALRSIRGADDDDRVETLARELRAA